jgi:hypothetical protein
MKALARSACVAVLMLLLAATASPAVAKGPVKVTVAGPGVDTTLRHYTTSGEDVDMGSLGEAARIYDVYGTHHPEPAADVSEKELGARYELRWDMGGEGDIVQHAYPFAEGGAWVYFLPGQKMFGKPVADGWSSAPALTEQLVGLGAVDNPSGTSGSSGSERPQAALATIEPEAAPVAPGADDADGSASYDVGVPAGLLLAGVLGVGAVVVGRRRLNR